MECHWFIRTCTDILQSLLAPHLVVAAVVAVDAQEAAVVLLVLRVTVIAGPASRKKTPTPYPDTI